MKTRRIKLQWKEMLFSLFIILISQLLVSYIPVQVPNVLRVLLVFGACVVFFLLVNLRDSDALRKNAVLTIVVFGSVACFIKPIQFGLDEESHLNKVIGMSESILFSKENSILPDFATVYNYDILRNPNNYKGEEKFFSEIHQKSIESGRIKSINNLALFPATIGWKIGEIVSPKIFVSYYLGRVANVLFYAFLTFIAISLSRKYKKVIYMFSSWPAMIWICAGYHYDSVYFGLSLILLALLTNFIDNQRKINSKDVVLFMTICLLFSFSKFPFVLMGSVILILSNKKFERIKVKIIAFLFFIIEMILAILYYSNTKIINWFYGIEMLNNNSDQPGLLYFIHHPLPLVRTFFDFFQSSLSSFSNYLPYSIANSNFLISLTLIFFIFLFLLLSVNLDLHLEKQFKIYIGFLFVLITFLIIYAISGDPRVYSKGDILVNGVQGRYYFLIILTIPILISDRLKKIFKPNDQNLYYEKSVCTILQYSVAYLNILTLAITIYTQIPHKL